MISQLQSVRTFIDRKLSDLVLWPQCEPDATSNADRGGAVIPVKGKRFRITSTSAYIDGPMGKLTMVDLEDNHIISGPKGDTLWAQIEAYIRRRANDLPEPAPVAAVVESAPPQPVYPDTRVPYLSQGVTYVPDWPIGGMTEIAAIVTKVISPTVICLTAFPMTGELFWRNDLMRRSDVHARNCWDFSEPELVVAPLMGDPIGQTTPVRAKKKAAA